MANYNKVILMGNLTRDPEVRYAQSGTAIVKFSLAVNRRFKNADDQWQEEPTFVDITMFGKRGEAFSRFHTKGKSAFIEGSLRFDQWDDKETGAKRSKLYVVGDNWEFVGSGSGSEGGGGGGGGNFGGGGGGGGQRESAPAGGGNRGGYSAPQQPSVDLDDTPF